MTRPRLRFASIPLLGSSGYDDLRWSLLLFPVWWLLGIEQFIWPVILLWSSFKLLVRKRFRISVPPLAAAFGLFLISQLFSAIFISASIRYISFVRTFSTFLSVFLLILIFHNSDLTDEQVGKLLDTTLLSIGAAGLLGLAAELGLWRPRVNSLISYVLPAGIKNTSYGSEIAFRSLGKHSWFSGLGNYYRLSSLFLYPTLFGSAVAFILPMGFYRFAHPSRTWTKPRSLLLIALLMFNLVFTTGRTAILSFLLAGALFMWFYARKKHHYRIALIFLAGMGLFAFIFLALIYRGVFGQLEGFINSFLYARGEGTVVSRFSIYQYTLEDFLQRPLWGWGTERDIEGLKIPLGSHSFYLALLYRFGLIGFVIYLYTLLKTWFSVAGKWRSASHPDRKGLAGFVLWMILVGLLDGLFTVPLLDINTLMFFWIPVILAVTRTREDSADPSLPKI